MSAMQKWTNIGLLIRLTFSQVRPSIIQASSHSQPLALMQDIGDERTQRATICRTRNSNQSVAQSDDFPRNSQLSALLDSLLHDWLARKSCWHTNRPCLLGHREPAVQFLCQLRADRNDLSLDWFRTETLIRTSGIARSIIIFCHGVREICMNVRQLAVRTWGRGSSSATKRRNQAEKVIGGTDRAKLKPSSKDTRPSTSQGIDHAPATPGHRLAATFSPILGPDSPPLCSRWRSSSWEHIFCGRLKFLDGERVGSTATGLSDANSWLNALRLGSRNPCQIVVKKGRGNLSSKERQFRMMLWVEDFRGHSVQCEEFVIIADAFALHAGEKAQAFKSSSCRESSRWPSQRWTPGHTNRFAACHNVKSTTDWPRWRLPVTCDGLLGHTRVCLGAECCLSWFANTSPRSLASVSRKRAHCLQILIWNWSSPIVLEICSRLT